MTPHPKPTHSTAIDQVIGDVRAAIKAFVDAWVTVDEQWQTYSSAKIVTLAIPTQEGTDAEAR